MRANAKANLCDLMMLALHDRPLYTAPFCGQITYHLCVLRYRMEKMSGYLNSRTVEIDKAQSA